MTRTIKVALAGAGAFGIKHLDGIKNIDGVEVVSLVGRGSSQPGKSLPNTASRTSPPNSPTALRSVKSTRSSFARRRQMHAAQSIACLKAGKHVQVEIPLARFLARCAGRRRGAEAERTGRDVRPHAPIQPQPSMGAPARSWPANSISSRWTCRHFSSAAQT